MALLYILAHREILKVTSCKHRPAGRTHGTRKYGPGNGAVWQAADRVLRHPIPAFNSPPIETEHGADPDVWRIQFPVQP